MKFLAKLSLFASLAGSAFSAAQAESVEICFNTLTVFETQGDFGNREEWNLEFYRVTPYGDEFLGKVLKRVPEKLAGEWSTDIAKCFTTNLHRNHSGVIVKVAGFERDLWKKVVLPTVTKEVPIGDSDDLYARDIDRSYSVGVSVSD